MVVFTNIPRNGGRLTSEGGTSEIETRVGNIERLTESLLAQIKQINAFQQLVLVVLGVAFLTLLFTTFSIIRDSNQYKTESYHKTLENLHELEIRVLELEGNK